MRGRSLRTYLVAVNISLLLIIGAAVGGLAYVKTIDSIEQSTDRLIEWMTRYSSSSIHETVEGAEEVSQILAASAAQLTIRKCADSTPSRLWFARWSKAPTLYLFMSVTPKEISCWFGACRKVDCCVPTSMRRKTPLMSPKAWTAGMNSFLPAATFTTMRTYSS